MRTTVDLPEPLLENAKEVAAQRRVTLSQVVQDALRRLLGQAPPETATEFRLYTVKGKLVRADLDMDRTSSLLTMDDEAEFARRES
jgi:Arc/MetJ-type ribon-helix-helix transcriptional regulator